MPRGQQARTLDPRPQVCPPFPRYWLSQDTLSSAFPTLNSFPYPVPSLLSTPFLIQYLSNTAVYCGSDCGVLLRIFVQAVYRGSDYRTL